jgi:hypothetical protein
MTRDDRVLRWMVARCANLITFLQTFLKTELHMTSVVTGAYLFVLILGAFCGFVSGAFLADAIGR